MLTLVCRFIVSILLYLIMKKNNSSLLETFAANVKKNRKEQGLSQEDLAFKANVHRTYIGMIERSEKNITLLNIEKIAKALNVPIAKLLKV